MSAISGAVVTDQALNNAGNTSSGFAALGSEEFLQIIFTELTNQDPLEPSDTKALLDQLNSIREIESDLELTQQLESLVTENQLASAGTMVGRYVTGRTEGLDPAEGFVVAALRQGDSISVQLDDGRTIPMSQIEEIFDPSLLGG